MLDLFYPFFIKYFYANNNISLSEAGEALIYINNVLFSTTFVRSETVYIVVVFGNDRFQFRGQSA